MDESQVRKWCTQVEEIELEVGRRLPRPLRKVVVGAVIPNPYAGRYDDSLTELIEAGNWLAAVLAAKALAALGDEAESYGKAVVVGEAGEMEHAAAVLHPKFGAPIRAAVGGVSIMPSAKKRGGAGTTIDIPLHHKRAMLVRSHFDAVEFRCPDAPRADEMVVALAVTNGGRPLARVGGLVAEEVIGSDGLR
jgi:hypothetical protein